jgi:synaptobrevin family protein YKT6
MKLYSLYIITRDGDKATTIDLAQDFSDVSYFYRKNAIELCDLAAANLATSPKPDIAMSAQEKQFMFHQYRKGNVAVVLVATEDYPSRSAFVILREMLSEYEQCQGHYPGGQSAVIKRAITEYQDPARADKLLKIHQNLEETQSIMVQNLAAAIARGESLSELAQKSEQISAQSKAFAREAEKMNSCCSLF